QAVGRIGQRDALRLEIVCRVRVVNQHAEHVHRPIGLFAHPLGDPERIDHAVAVATRGDPDDFHGYRVYADSFLSICSALLMPDPVQIKLLWRFTPLSSTRTITTLTRTV